jgi:hypothetical protein
MANEIDYWIQDAAELNNRVDSYFQDVIPKDLSDHPAPPQLTLALEELKKRTEAQQAAPEEDPDKELMGLMDDMETEDDTPQLLYTRRASERRARSIKRNLRESRKNIGPLVGPEIDTAEDSYLSALVPGSVNEEVTVEPWNNLVDKELGRGRRGMSSRTGYFGRKLSDAEAPRAARTAELLTPGVFPWGWSGPVEHQFLNMTEKDR